MTTAGQLIDRVNSELLAGTVEERACAAVQAKLVNITLLNDGDLTEGFTHRENTQMETL